MIKKDLLKFIFELSQLRKIKHEGWRLVGIDNPESVADHSLRAAQIGFLLAELEGYENPLEMCSILVFHDIEECRVGDIHKIANRYIKVDEEAVVKEQTEKLDEMGKKVFELWKKSEEITTRAGIIAKDADLLEQAFTAKEFMEKGYTFAQDWINNVSKKLQTKSAKDILVLLKEVNSNDWWQGLKKID